MVCGVGGRWKIFLGGSLFGPCKMFYDFSFQLKFLEIQLFFSISILSSTVLKRWNFPKIRLWLKFSQEVTFFQYKIIWQQNNKLKMGPFKKYVTCIMANFTTFNFATLCQFYSTTSLASFSKFRNYRKRGKKIFCIYGCFSVSSYINGGRKSHL